MNGVEILSSEAIYNTFLPEWCIAIGFILIVTFAALMAWNIAEERFGLMLICLVLLIGSFFVMILSDTDNKHDVNHIEYKVTIDDSVSMNEFLDKYEILDQEGKIYTVKERE